MASKNAMDGETERQARATSKNNKPERQATQKKPKKTKTA